MNKFLYFCSLLATVFLLLGSFLFPGDLIMWFASTSRDYNIVRSAIALLLLVLMFTLPPRGWYFRCILAGVALGLVGWMVYSFQINQLRVLDMALYVQLTVVFSLAALELTYEEDIQPIVSRYAKVVP